MSRTAPQDNEIIATRRAIGKPTPGFCPSGCGYVFWFSGVSGIETVVPSTSLTERPFHFQPSSDFRCSNLPVSRTNRLTRLIGRRNLALQYDLVFDEHGGSPCATRSASTFATAFWQEGSELSTCDKKAHKVTIGGKNSASITAYFFIHNILDGFS